MANLRQRHSCKQFAIWKLQIGRSDATDLQDAVTTTYQQLAAQRETKLPEPLQKVLSFAEQKLEEVVILALKNMVEAAKVLREEANANAK